MVFVGKCGGLSDCEELVGVTHGDDGGLFIVSDSKEKNYVP